MRYGAVAVSDDLGQVLFTGYISSPPAVSCSGEYTNGLLTQASTTAISDELLLDRVLTTTRSLALNQSAVQSLQAVTTQSGTGQVAVSSASTGAIVGRFETSAGSKWSTSAGRLAVSARSAYRVLGGVVQLTTAGSITHSLSEADGTLQVNGLKASAVKLLANDVTVCGAVEPAAYVTETFQGDGVTVKFALTERPFEPVTRAKLTLIDLFQEPTLNPQLWQWVDSSSRLSITSSGLTCSGGSGRDGETTVSALEQLEIGGSLVLEAGGFQVQSGSTGIVLGLYFGSISVTNCMAGFSVGLIGGVTQISALIEGSAAGSSFTPVVGHLYTLRTRIFCFEMERVEQSYYYLGPNGVGRQGGNYVPAGGRLVLEVQDVTNGVPGVPIILYDGSIAAMPSTAQLGLIDSGNLNCSIKSLSCKQGAPLWVTLTPSGGTPETIHVGTSATGGDCSINAAGNVTFYPSFIPPSGSLITVLYRSQHRAVARRNTGQQTGSGPEPPTQMWMGSVHEPPAWSSTDCDNAALALLQSSSVASAAWEGTYTALNSDELWDVWPGDVLAINSASNAIVANVVVRDVQIDLGHSSPQKIKYVVRFANDWAEDLALKLSNTIPEDAWLPLQPATSVPLANPLAMAVGLISGTQIPVSMNVTPPQGGGFEVRRRDWAFGPGTDSDLVLRSPVPNFIILRLAPVEQYFIRMYDSALPTNYSRFSAAIFVSVPL